MFREIVAGVLIGVANLIPGISGATVAVITNQYKKIMNQVELMISFNFKQINYRFLLTIGISAVAGVIVFSSLLHYVFTHYQSYALICVFILILGSLDSVKLSYEFRSWSKKILSPYFLIGLLLMIGLIVLDNQGMTFQQKASQVAIFFSGFIAMMAMIIPGVSGSMVLIILGTYDVVLGFIKDLSVIQLVPFFIGIIVAVVSMSKLIKWALSKKTNQFESLVFGLLFGSTIYIGLLIDLSKINILIASGCCLLSLLTARLFVGYGKR